MPRQRFWQTQRFKEIQKEWEEKLKASGFVDAESNGRLCQNAANSYRTKVPEIINGKQEYYELIGYWCHVQVFRDDVEKHVMERHAEGIKVKQIGDELRNANKRNSRETIEKIIRFYREKWGVKKRR